MLFAGLLPINQNSDREPVYLPQNRTKNKQAGAELDQAQHSWG